MSRRRGNKRMRMWDSITYSKNMSLRKLQNSERLGSLLWCQICHHKESDMTWQLNNTNEDTGSNEGFGPGWSGERFRWKGRLPILWYKSLNPRQWAQYFECVTKHCFLKKQQQQQQQQLFSSEERELWLSLFSRFSWRMSKASGVGWVWKNQVTSC